MHIDAQTTLGRNPGDPRMKAVLLLDDISIAGWQRRALEHASREVEITLVISCRNTRTRKRVFRHALYYLTALATLRGGLAKRERFEVGRIPVIEFDAEAEGGWQRLPGHIEEAVVASGAGVVVKFGMSLLRVPDANRGFPPILSFHHGDPREFRGRPAGFFEVLQGAATSGVIVQSITNRLDGGAVLAECRVRVTPWSYRRTLQALYERSESLLSGAVRSVVSGARIEVRSLGPVFTLPGNMTVLRFWLLLAVRQARRLAYGAFVEKRWSIGLHPSFVLDGEATLDVGSIQRAAVPSGYSFLADPFPGSDQSVVRAEGLSRRTRLGEIVELDVRDLEFRRAVLRGGHFSYPFSVVVDERELLVPEVAGHLPASWFEETVDGWVSRPFEGLEDRRIVDPTILFHLDRWYLFCGLVGSEGDELHLFHAPRIEGPFHTHPRNPIVVDPTRARMGGSLVSEGGRLLRLGQDCSRAYGDGLTICSIESLSPTEYRETVVGSVRCRGAKGPHTLNRIGDDFVLDFYLERPASFAWLGRLRAKWARSMPDDEARGTQRAAIATHS